MYHKASQQVDVRNDCRVWACIRWVGEVFKEEGIHSHWVLLENGDNSVIRYINEI